MIKKWTNIAQLRAYLAADFSHFMAFYKPIIARLKKESPNKKSFLTTVFFSEIEKKMTRSWWKENRAKPLFGIPYTAKDTFCTADAPTTGSSNSLINYQMGENASAINYLNQAGAILVAKVHLDEFGAGGTGLFANVGEFVNPHNEQKIVGGSSSGSVLSVVNQIASFSLCSDTGDSARLPAVINGVYGYKPTFGSVSRFGMMSCFAPTLDTVGLITNEATNLRHILPALIRRDEKDAANFAYSFSVNHHFTAATKKIAYFDLPSELVDPKALVAYNELIVRLKKAGFSLTKITIPPAITKTLQIVYELTAYPSLLSTLANINGLQFGPNIESERQPDYWTKTEQFRTNHLGGQVKQRMITGAFFMEPELQPYRQKALEYRHFVNEYITKLFKKYDFLLHLGSDFAPTVEQGRQEQSSFQPKVHSWFLFANFGGFPSYAIPFTWIGSLSLGINLFSATGTDADLVEMGAELATKIDFTPRFCS